MLIGNSVLHQDYSFFSVLIVCLVFQLSSTVSSLQEGEACRIGGLVQGVCTSYHLCQSAQDEDPSPLLCNAQDKRSQLVCCKDHIRGERIYEPRHDSNKLNNEFVESPERTSLEEQFDDIETIYDVKKAFEDPPYGDSGRTKHSISGTSNHRQQPQQSSLPYEPNDFQPSYPHQNKPVNNPRPTNVDRPDSQDGRPKNNHYNEPQFNRRPQSGANPDIYRPENSQQKPNQHFPQPDYSDQSQNPNSGYNPGSYHHSQFSNTNRKPPSYDPEPQRPSSIYNPQTPKPSRNPSPQKPSSHEAHPGSYEETHRPSSSIYNPRPQPSHNPQTPKPSRSPSPQKPSSHEAHPGSYEETHRPSSIYNPRPQPSYNHQTPKPSRNPSPQKPSSNEARPSSYEEPHRPSSIYNPRPQTSHNPHTISSQPNRNPGSSQKPRPSSSNVGQPISYEEPHRPSSGYHPQPSTSHNLRPSSFEETHRPPSYNPNPPSEYNPTPTDKPLKPFTTSQKPFHSGNAWQEAPKPLVEDINGYPDYNAPTSRRPPVTRRPKPAEKTVSEMKCKEYSEIVTETIAGLPLTTDPKPVEINIQKCNFNAHHLIVGGQNTSVGEFPHMAAVGFMDRKRRTIAWNCGGSLVSEYFVLTAAHCTTSSYGAPSVVRLGEHNLKRGDDGAHPVDYLVKEVVRHPQYHPPARYHDIALLRLSRPVAFTIHIRPACLYSKPTFTTSKTVATGWGRIQYAEEQSDVLLKVVLSIIDNERCNGMYKSEGKTEVLASGIIGEQMCAGELTGGKDTCQGDSGGPIEVTSQGNQCVHHVIGVTSFGKRCGLPNAPGVYTRVSSYRTWIEGVIWPDLIRKQLIN